ncbi:MAG TPA: hypothetical protein VMZ27_03420 [Candidatus Saccharimonadales bacterium]|nr:hypothetical protein [Candidatus Saccharimonadales bacterium]
MKPLKKMVCYCGAAGVLLAAAQQGWSEAKQNPYLTIVDRNPFGLKPPPPPPDPTPVQPVVPPAKVVLTGITSLFGPTSKRALLEITEQEPGKPANVVKPILREGDRVGSVEVVSIDLDKNLVRIKNGGQESDLKFADPSTQTAKATPGVQTPPIPTPLPHPGAPQAANGPTIISPGSADNSSRGSSVAMYGAQVPGTTPNGVPSALGVQDGTGRIIPPRAVRTDPVAQYANMMAQSAANQNKPAPPLPPIPGANNNNAGGNNSGFPALPSPTGYRR